MNHLKFAWDNAYDVYSAHALHDVMQERPDIQDTTEEDGYHFRSEGDLQPILDVCVEYDLNYEILELNPGITLHAIQPAPIDKKRCGMCLGRGCQACDWFGIGN